MSLLITLSCIALGIYVAQAAFAMLFGGFIGYKAYKESKKLGN